MSPAPIPRYTGKEWTVEPLEMSFDEAVKKVVQPVLVKEARVEEEEIQPRSAKKPVEPRQQDSHQT